MSSSRSVAPCTKTDKTIPFVFDMQLRRQYPGVLIGSSVMIISRIGVTLWQTVNTEQCATS